MLEAALTLPLLLLVCVGIIEFGRLYQTWQVMTNAAREGARIAVLPGYSQADVQNRVAQYVLEGTGDNTLSPTAVLTVPPVTIDPDGAGGKPGFPAARVTVTMTYNYMIVGPVLQLFNKSLSSITLTAVSTMRIES